MHGDCSLWQAEGLCLEATLKKACLPLLLPVGCVLAENQLFLALSLYMPVVLIAMYIKGYIN